MAVQATATGTLDRAPQTKAIPRSMGSDLELCKASLNWTVMRGDKEVRMWLDCEATGPRCWELADVPLNVEVTLTGLIERQSWQSKQSGEWVHKHVLVVQTIEVGGTQGDGFVHSEARPDEDSIPF